MTEENYVTITFRERSKWEDEPKQIAQWIGTDIENLETVVTDEFKNWIESNSIKKYSVLYIDFNNLLVRFYNKDDAMKYIRDWK